MCGPFAGKNDVLSRPHNSHSLEIVVYMYLNSILSMAPILALWIVVICPSWSLSVTHFSDSDNSSTTTTGMVHHSQGPQPQVVSHHWVTIPGLKLHFDIQELGHPQKVVDVVKPSKYTVEHAI